MTQDRIFEARDGRDPFRFDESVASVFPDMLRRSIPGYAATIEAIGSLAARFVKPGTNCYDLGCSLGAATLAMQQGSRTGDIRLVAVDKAPAMVSRCREICAAYPEIDVVEGDIRDVSVENATMIVLNYTLQFLEKEDRDELVSRLANGLNPGGLLVLSEKVVDEDDEMEALLIDLHEEHKRRNDYSELEIARKRTALENVLVPETISEHRRRLSSAGFRHIGVWLRYFNFVSIIAIKGPGE